MKHWLAGAVVFCSIGLACSAAPELAQAGDEKDTVIVESAEVASVEAAARRTREYTDARWFFTSDDDINAWYALTHQLEDDFDNVCGDTFCEGDYGNYQSLGIRCSVEARAGSVGVCVWTFAASQDEVVVSTGNVKVSTKTWRCKLPVVRDTPVADLLRVLSASSQGPLHAQLPRSEASIYDGLVSCL